MLLLCLKREESHQSPQHTAKQEIIDKKFNYGKLVEPSRVKQGPYRGILLVVQRRSVESISVKPIACQKKMASVKRTYKSNH